MNWIIWLFLIVTRLRDRLRCPRCGAVGTYKLHTPVTYPECVPGPPWRWLCKYCGYYRDSDGERNCRPSPDLGCWIFADQKEGIKGNTPWEMVYWQGKLDKEEADETGTVELPVKIENSAKIKIQVWPWRG